MRKIILVLIFFVGAKLFFAVENYEISILTCSSGDKIYSVFGHSAIRVVNKEKNEDFIYNFGTFDFDDSNFVLKFIRKKLLYSLSIQGPEYFLYEYTSENRTVLEQKLNLDESQSKAIVDRLEFLYRPENRYYLYAFLDKNCTTEVRDLLLEVGVEFPVKDLDVSNRELILSYLDHDHWYRLGINMIAGKSLDRKSDIYQSMFLPDYLCKELENTFVNNEKIVISEEILNEIPFKNKEKSNFWLSPLFVFSILLIFVLIFNSKILKISVLSMVGLVGLLLLFLSIISSHVELKSNLNLLWCNPLYLVYIPLILMKKSNKVFSYILLFMIFISGVVWITGVQKFDIAVIPLMLILIVLILKELSIIKFGNIHSS